MSENVDGVEFEELDLIPTVRVGVKGGSFFAEVIEMYELPFERVIEALAASSGPNQMLAMLEIFKLALIDQSKIAELEVLSFNEMADILGQWAMLSTPPVVSEVPLKKRPRIRTKSIELESTEDVEKLIDKLMDPNTTLDELYEIASQIDEEAQEKPRGRHAKPYDPELDGPLNGPGDDITPF